MQRVLVPLVCLVLTACDSPGDGPVFTGSDSTGSPDVTGGDVAAPQDTAGEETAVPGPDAAVDTAAAEEDAPADVTGDPDAAGPQDATPDEGGPDVGEPEPDVADVAEPEPDVAEPEPDVPDVPDVADVAEPEPDVAEPEPDVPDVPDVEPDTAPDVVDADVADAGPDVPDTFEAQPCTPFTGGCGAGSWCEPSWLDPSAGFCAGLEGDEAGFGESCWLDTTSDCCGDLCQDPDVRECTCAVDSFCCESWDAICSQEARLQCGHTCGGEPCGGGLICEDAFCGWICDPADGTGCEGEETCAEASPGGAAVSVGVCVPAPTSPCAEGEVPCLEQAACCALEPIAPPNGVGSWDMAVDGDGRVHVLYSVSGDTEAQLRLASLGEGGWAEEDMGAVTGDFALDAWGEGAVAIAKVRSTDFQEKGQVVWHTGDGEWRWRAAVYDVPTLILDRTVDVVGTSSGVYALFRNEESDYEVHHGAEGQLSATEEVETKHAWRGRIGRSAAGDDYVLALQVWHTNNTYEFEVAGLTPSYILSTVITGELGLRFTATPQGHHVFYRSSGGDVALARRALSGYDWDTETLYEDVQWMPWDATADASGAWHLCYAKDKVLFYQREGAAAVELAGSAYGCKLRTDDQGGAHIVYRVGYGADAALHYLYRAP